MTLRDASVLVVFVAVPVALCYGLGYLARWSAGRRDPIDTLITAPKWCKDGAAWMDRVDEQKVARAGERRWQETLRAQRKTRKPPTPQPKPAKVRRFPRAVGQ